MNRVIAFLVLWLLLLPCSLKSSTVAGDSEPPSPPFWYYFTIEGLDSDQDGVRDDVEIWINNYTQEYHYNRALKQYARVQLKVFGIVDYANAQIHLEQDRKAGYCLTFVKVTLHWDEIGRNAVSEVLLLNKILNNYWRRRQFNKMGSLIPRGTWTSDFKKENEQFMSCEFKLLNPEKLMRSYMKRRSRNTKLIESIYKIYPQAKDE